jgi:predicted RNase H-like HicB family nuclease
LPRVDACDILRIVSWEESFVMKYKVVIHKAEEGGYWAEVPAVPGCLSQGETVDEVMENIHEALAACMETLAEMGKPVTEDVEVREVAV